MGWRGVVKAGSFAVLLSAAGCRSNGARPDATGTGGSGVDGGLGGSGVGGSGGMGASGGSSVGGGASSVAREFAVDLSKKPDVDILFLIDDSSSMAAAQATLRQSFARFVAALRALPDGFPNLHIAVVSSDMGAGDGSIAGCNATGGKNGVFQYAPRGTCTSTGLQSGATFISDVGGTKNYTGNLEDVLGCIAPLGQTGCGFPQPFAAITRALGADGQPAPAENQGFLRPNAYLAIVLLTNKDDCSVPEGVPLFDTSANLTLASQLGPPTRFRCNEFGHLCDGVAPKRLAPNGSTSDVVTYQSCVSAEGTGLLTAAADIANRLKALKADPAQVLVASIHGPRTPYSVHWRTPSITDTGPWPEITHSCTATDGSFADPGVRATDLAGKFGDNGFVSSICDADYGPTLESLAAKIGAGIAGPCIGDPIADDPTRAGYQPQCSVQLSVNNAQGGFTTQAVPPCADSAGAAPCWSLSTDAAGCQRPKVTFAGAPPSPAVARYECAVCTAGVVGQGCSVAGRTGDSVQRSLVFGNPCDPGPTVTGGPGAVVATSLTGACMSLTCLLPPAQKDPFGTGPLCTSSCSTNADCTGGIAGNANDPNDPRCKTGFVCMVPTTVGDFCCQRMCVCRDYVVEPVGGFQTPPVCMGGTAGVCASVH